MYFKILFLFNILKTKIPKIIMGYWLAGLLLLITVVTPSSAQIISTHPVTQLADSITQAAQEDTIYALERLFFEQRRRNSIYGVIMSPLILFSGVRVVSTYKQPNSNEKKVAISFVGASYLLLFVRRLQLIYRYRAGREKKLELALQEAKPLPYKIRRALKKDYFSVQTTGK